MPYKFSLALLLASGIGVTQPAFSTTINCMSTDARQAVSEAYSLKDWNSVYESYKKMRACDDGELAQDYSDNVSRLLAHNWDQLSVLIDLIKHHPMFEEFVIRHIDNTNTLADAELMQNNAQKHCPVNAASLCKRILFRITSLRKEL